MARGNGVFLSFFSPFLIDLELRLTGPADKEHERAQV
jgi:hypothetical protein